MSSAKPSSRRRKHRWICEEGSVICQNERDRTRHMLCMSYVTSSLCILFSLFMRNFEICKASLIILLPFYRSLHCSDLEGLNLRNIMVSSGSPLEIFTSVQMDSTCGNGLECVAALDWVRVTMVGAAGHRVTLWSLFPREKACSPSSVKFHM